MNKIRIGNLVISERMYDNFNQSIVRQSDDKCWDYRGDAKAQIGLRDLNGKAVSMTPRRLMYVIHNKIEDHTKLPWITTHCRNPDCINPNHLTHTFFKTHLKPLKNNAK